LTSKVQLDTRFVQVVRDLADKYIDVMHKSLEKHTEVDARQCIYYTGYGATLALFETLANLMAHLPKDQRDVLVEARNAGQYVLDLCSRVEAMRKHEVEEVRRAVDEVQTQTKDAH
jgi:hypothetical protein